MRSVANQLSQAGSVLSLRVGRLLTRPVKGAAMTEYAILVALIAMAAMGAIQSFGGGIAAVFGNLLAHLPTH